MDEQKPPGLQIAQIFLLSAQFAHREDALALPAGTREGEQRVGVQIQMREHNTGQAASVAVKVFSDPDSQTALYRYSLEMVGVVEKAPNEENLAPRDFILKGGVTILFPFLREALANLTMRGRFGPVWLKPFNVQAALQEVAGEDAKSLPANSAPES
jgi:preprotein translocase subunit SecB